MDSADIPTCIICSRADLFLFHSLDNFKGRICIECYKEKFGLAAFESLMWHITKTSGLEYRKETMKKIVV